jgi:hypothetical protein
MYFGSIFHEKYEGRNHDVLLHIRYKVSRWHSAGQVWLQCPSFGACRWGLDHGEQA